MISLHRIRHLAFAGLALTSTSLYGADVTATWTAATTGAWNADGNWTNAPLLGGFPNSGNGGVATYDAVISITGSPYTVNLNTSVTVEDLLLSSANATINHTAGTFTATGAVTISAGMYQLNGGTISNTVINPSGSGSLVFGANSSNLLSGVTVNGDLTLNTTSARTRIAGGTTFTTAHLAAISAELGFAPGQTLTGTILFEGAATGVRFVSMNGTAGSFTIGATGVIRTETGLAGNAQIGVGTNFGGAMALLNQGLISSQTSGRTITINPATSFTNTGTIEAINGGILAVNGLIGNLGTAIVSGTGSQISFNGTNYVNNQTLTVGTGTTATFNGSWSNTGAINLGAGTLNLDGTFSTAGLGTFSNSGGTVNLTGTLNNTASTLTLNATTGSWNLLGGTISGGTLGFANGQNLLIGANSGNLLSGVTVNGDLTLNTTSARTRIAGGTTFTTAHLAAISAELGFAPGQTLTGTILFEGAATGVRFVSMNGTAGSFTIGATGVIRTETGLAGNAQIGVGTNFGGAMALLNQGLISSQTSGRTITINPATSFTNTGTIEAINGGILAVNGLIGNLGTAIVSGTGSQISFNGTNYVNNQTLTVGTGTTATFNGSWSNTGAINLGAGTLNLDGTFSTAGLGTFSNSGGTVNLTGTLNNTASTLTLNATTGSWNLLGGTISGGTLGFANGQNLLIGANSGNLLSGVTVNGDLTLNTTSARTRIAGGTTFTTAHLAAISAELGFAPGQTLTGTILFEGAATGVRFVSMNGTAGSFTIGATGVIRTETGLAGNAQIGVGTNFGGAMALLNQGLISSQVSGRTITINPATSFTNEGVVEAIDGGSLDITATNWSSASGATLRALNGSTLSLSGAWSNGGSLTIDNSTLNLGGTYTTTGLNLAGFTRTGGTVNLTGTLTNSGTLTLNSATGSWVLNGGTISGGTLAYANGQNLLIGANSGNLLSGVTVNGDLTLNTTSARTRIAGGTTFTTAHLAAISAELGFAPGQTLTGGTILFEGAATGNRFVSMNNTAGSFTIGATGVIRTETGLAGNAQIGTGSNFGGAMTLLNQGLISSQTSGRTITINPATSFTNTGTIEAVNSGVLSIPNGYTQSAGVTRVDDGTINSTTIGIVAGTLEGSGTINATVNSSGIINLNADGTIAGPLNATGGAWTGQGIVTGLSTASVGTFTIGSGAHLHANGGLNVTGVGTIAAASATAKITGNVSYLSSSNSTFGGILLGAGKTLTMNNAAATFTLAGANTYTGATTVTAGTLRAGIASVSGVSGAFGKDSPVTMANASSAILDLAGFNTQIGSVSGGGTSGGNVTLGAGTLTFAGTNSSPAVYGGAISGSGGITKIGTGTQALIGTNAYAGRTTVARGTLRLDFTSLATPTNILNSASALTLGGGTLSVLGKTGASVASAQTLGDLTLGANTFSKIVLDPNNSGTGGTTLTLGNTLTRNPGSTLLIDYSSANTGTRRVRTPGAVTGSGTAGPNGIFGYALVRESGGTGFAKQDGSFNFIRNTTPGTVLTTSNSVAGTTGTDFTTVSTDPGYTVPGGTLTLANVAHAANTLSIDSTGGGTLNLGGASGVFALTSNAILMQGTGNYTIQSGALGASGSEVIIHQLASGTLTISSAISGGAGALTKDGSGTLTLTGLQNYATLTTTDGVTNLQVPLGTGGSTIYANAPTNISVSQTLEALNIGADGVLTLSTSVPPAPATDFDAVSSFADSSGMDVELVAGASVAVVPEPGSISLFILGALGLLSRRRRG